MSGDGRSKSRAWKFVQGLPVFNMDQKHAQTDQCYQSQWLPSDLDTYMWRYRPLWKTALTPLKISHIVCFPKSFVGQMSIILLHCRSFWWENILETSFISLRTNYLLYRCQIIQRGTHVKHTKYRVFFNIVNLESVFSQQVLTKYQKNFCESIRNLLLIIFIFWIITISLIFKKISRCSYPPQKTALFGGGSVTLDIFWNIGDIHMI